MRTHVAALFRFAYDAINDPALVGTETPIANAKGTGSRAQAERAKALSPRNCHRPRMAKLLRFESKLLMHRQATQHATGSVLTNDAIMK